MNLLDADIHFLYSAIVKISKNYKYLDWSYRSFALMPFPTLYQFEKQLCSVTF